MAGFEWCPCCRLKLRFKVFAPTCVKCWYSHPVVLISVCSYCQSQHNFGTIVYEDDGLMKSDAV